MEVKSNWPLQRYNTFGVDVDSLFFADVNEEQELKALLSDERYSKMPKMILGGGSNILFLCDYSGLVIRPNNNTLKVDKRDDGCIKLCVGAGYVLEDLVKYTVEQSWWGLENLAGIPGRVGGAAVQNVGAYGTEISELIEQVTVIRKDNLSKEYINVKDCEYSYRKSLFKSKDSPYVVWEVLLSLSTDKGPQLEYKALAEKWDAEELSRIEPKEVMREVLRLRKNKLPDPKVLCSAGSFFSNPVISQWQYDRLKSEYPSVQAHKTDKGIKVSAAWLIEQCGWKSYREKDAGVYEAQPLVLVNYGSASGEEVWDLACRIKQSVATKFEVSLEPEVCLIGTEEDKIEAEYVAVLDSMYHSLPMFQRIGGAAYKATLSTTEKMMSALHEPQKRFKSIHIAGTNGKGSCSHLLASVFQNAGFKTGLYTSPHLKDFRERIRVNGEMIPKTRVIDFYNENEKHFTKLKASFFEMTVAMAFDYFAKERVDIAIIEVGMGGRLDSTNVITPELSIITNISIDHVQFLGNSLPKIAEEKAGIIKESIPVVIGETQIQTASIFQEKAKKMKSPITFADSTFYIQKQDEEDGENAYITDIYKGGKLFITSLKCALMGETYQCKNIITVMAALDILRSKYQISEQDIRNGFATVVEKTGLRGRWEKLSTKPLVYADTGHNEGGINLVIRQIEKMHYSTLRIVWGMVNDKDIEHILALLPAYAVYYYCAANIERAMPAVEMAKSGNAHNLNGKSYNSVREALDAAKADSKENDLIYVGGSTFVVAEVL